MYTRICAPVRACTLTSTNTRHTHARIQVHTDARRHASMHARTHIRMSLVQAWVLAYVDAYARVNVWTCVYVHMYVCTCQRVNVYIRVHLCLHFIAVHMYTCTLLVLSTSEPCEQGYVWGCVGKHFLLAAV